MLDLRTPSGPEGSSGSTFHMCRRVPSHLIFNCSIILKMTSQGYQVIARRWRPQQFDELVGQDHIVQTLKNAIESKRIAHAYLFVGPRGTGKTSTARLFAKALNAEGGPSIAPDDSSEISRSIMNGSCMDVIEIDGASNNSVDQIRSLREECQYAPAQASFKIYIIDEVHMLTTAAFNALLKTLEEPPAHVKFFFATTEAHKVLPTIVSRCQRFEFRPIADSVIAKKLEVIAQSEEIEVEVNALNAIARLANGGMRDAQSILDQMISFCGSAIKEADVLDVYGMVGIAEIEELAQAMAALDYSKVIERIGYYVQEGRDLIRVHHDLVDFIRTALLDAIRQNGKTALLGTPMTTASLMRMNDVLQKGEASLKKGLSERSNFEVMLLKAAEESRSLEIDGLIAQVIASEQKEKKKRG
jgi:DNA polymerase-3 subunit gamma/tau